MVTPAAIGTSNCDTSATPTTDTIESDHFYIEYSPALLGGGLDIQDYIDSLEEAWNTEVVDFGWAKPPVLTANPPPNNKYHVRIDTLGLSLYGFVSDSGDHAGLVGNNPNTAWNDGDARASCMVLNQDYSTFPSTPQVSLDSTTAHEFNHSLQYGYGALNGVVPDDSFVEGGATWMEDEVQDAANDNYNYLWPDFTFDMGEYGDDPYAYWITFRGLSERYGTGTAGGAEQVMQDFWEQTSQNVDVSPRCSRRSPTRAPTSRRLPRLCRRGEVQQGVRRRLRVSPLPRGGAGLRVGGRRPAHPGRSDHGRHLVQRHGRGQLRAQLGAAPGRRHLQRQAGQRLSGRPAPRQRGLRHRRRDPGGPAARGGRHGRDRHARLVRRGRVRQPPLRRDHQPGADRRQPGHVRGARLHGLHQRAGHGHGDRRRGRVSRPAGGGGGTGSKGGTTTGKDTTAPIIRLTFRTRRQLVALLRSGLLIRVRSNEAAAVKGDLLIGSSTFSRLARGARRIVVGRGSTRLSKAGSKRLRLKLTRRAKRVLRRGGSFSLILRVRASDSARNSRTASRRLRVRR